MPRKQSDLLRRVGANVRSLREERGLTQEQVGERSGFTAKYISEIERGHRNPPLTTLAAIATAGLGCSLDRVVAQPTARRSTARSTEGKADGNGTDLPRSVRAVAEEIAEISSFHLRARVLGLVRSVVRLARDRAAS